LAPRVSLLGAAPLPRSVPAGYQVTAAYTPDIGLYLFLGGAVLLVISGYQLLFSTHADQLATAPYAMPAAMRAPYAISIAPVASASPFSAVPGAPAASPDASMPALATPTTTTPDEPPGAASGPVLPGTARWDQPQEAPLPLRPSVLGGGGPRSLGPRPGR
ncbi:MAG: hypothetical protein IVW57_15560, partial [Ktedonobacterales bacterium]|nr:hypothetical protein [Ktedonobacterales bacterium]